MSVPLLICTDLDRTLLPNGQAPESPGVRDTLAGLVSREEINLAYVSGRDLQLVLHAMEEYRLPRPRFIIGDVGTSIHEWTAGCWQPSASWPERILGDWNGRRPAEIIEALDSVEGMVLQAPERQGPAKISYYTTQAADRSEFEAEIARHLELLDVGYRLVRSRDEVNERGFLDILPASASKLHAIEFLIDRYSYARERTVFAGDSGNDLEALTSSLPAVLVANAAEDIRSLAAEQAAARGNGGALYLARGGFLGTNGNYAAGILEGVAHYFPETVRWMGERHGKE